MRRTLPLLSAAAMLAALTACAGQAAPTPAQTSAGAGGAAVDVCSAEAGSASDAVTVAGDLGAAPQVTFNAGITAETTERTTVIAGNGEQLVAGGSAEVAYSIYNGGTGALIESYGYADGEPVTFAADATKLLPGLAKAIGCASAGSRVAAVIPAVDAWGEAGNQQAGFGAGESLVAVIDIESIVPTRAWGADQQIPEGFPQVTLADDGTPSVAIPGGDAPADLQVAVLKKGDGAEVPASASVTIQYLGVKWSDGTTFDQSWDAAPASFSLDAVVPGFAQAIAGQTVGSQVIAVIPPALGYGEATPENTNELAGETLVFVIDILAIN